MTHMPQTETQKRMNYHTNRLVISIYEYANRELNYHNGWDEIAEGWNKQEIISTINDNSITTFTQLVDFFQEMITLKKEAANEHLQLQSTY